jgi:two-component system cell cycle response regulator DivK
MRIVYVEDNVANVALIQRICQMTNDELTTYSDAQSALDGIDADSADLILMDINLGTRSIDGLQLTRLLRQKGIGAPIVAITAYDTFGNSERYAAVGCNGYVRKPVSVAGMLEVINGFRA